MKANWTTMVVDPRNRPSAEARSQALRRMAEEVFGALRARLTNTNLPIDPPAGCPDALAKRIGKYDERAAVFEARRDAWLERYVSLPLKEAEASAKPRAMIEEREAALMEQFEVFAEHRALLEARGELLADVASALREQEKAAAVALEQEQAKGEKALHKAGDRPENDPHYHAAPEPAKTRFRQRVNGLEPVRAAQDALTQVQEALEATEAHAAKIPDDVELVEALRYAARGEAVGSL